MGHRKEKRFNIRARLFIGSLPNEVDEEWLRELFKPHSDVSEVFLHKEKGFGFVRCVSISCYLESISGFNAIVAVFEVSCYLHNILYISHDTVHSF